MFRGSASVVYFCGMMKVYTESRGKKPGLKQILSGYSPGSSLLRLFIPFSLLATSAPALLCTSCENPLADEISVLESKEGSVRLEFPGYGPQDPVPVPDSVQFFIYSDKGTHKLLVHRTLSVKTTTMPLEDILHGEKDEENVSRTGETDRNAGLKVKGAGKPQRLCRIDYAD